MGASPVTIRTNRNQVAKMLVWVDWKPQEGVVWLGVGVGVERVGLVEAYVVGSYEGRS